MATVNFTAGPSLIDNQIYTWASLTATNNDGEPSGYVESGDRSVQVTGEFSGATVTIQGTLDGVNWFPLKGPDTGTDLTFTSAGLRAVLENVVFIRPLVTDGDGSTSLTVILCIRR